MYKSIDLFAGIGGIRLGFDQAFGDDIKTVFISELDEKAVEKTYKANFMTVLMWSEILQKSMKRKFLNMIYCLQVFLVRRFLLRGIRKDFRMVN